MDAPSDPIAGLAQQSLGISYLYPYQRLVVANTLDADEENRFQVVVLPTGSGKTLCFTLPMLVLDGLTVVVYPLLALIDDQTRRIRESGVTARVLRGGQTSAEREAIYTEVRQGRVGCLLTNPETLSGARVRKELGSVDVAHLVIDEAHCVTEWGTTFRPAYLTLAETIRLIRPRVVTAFTATASQSVLESMCRELFSDRRPHLVLGDPDRPNISYSVVHAHSKEAALHELLRCGVKQPAIVFCRSRKRCEGVARDLAPLVGFEHCAAYHAGLTAEERAATEEWFFAAPRGVLAATCAYGMGVDKPNIRTVIHYELPSSVEAFLQESGRAGRDRLRASSIVLWNSGDPPRERDPTRAGREQIMRGYLRTVECRRAYLLEAMGAEPQMCFGCDRCEPEAEDVSIAGARREISTAHESALRCARQHRRIVTPRQLSLELSLEWSQQARVELVTGLIRDRTLRVHRWGPWNGRIDCGRSTKAGRPRVDRPGKVDYVQLDSYK